MIFKLCEGDSGGNVNMKYVIDYINYINYINYIDYMITRPCNHVIM